MMPGQAPQPGMPGPPPNPQLQQAQQRLQQIKQRLEQIAENKQVLALLRDEKTRGFRIDIETDSTIEPDEQAEKQRRMEFLEVSSKFFQQAMPMLQAMPQAAPMLAQSYMFLVRGFRAGRELEDTIEQTMEAISHQAQQPKPNPEQQKLEAQIKAATERHQQDMKHADEQHRQVMELKAEEGRQKWQSHAMTMKEKEDAGIQANAGELRQAIVELAGKVEETLQEVAAPAEIIRDRNGRAMGVRKGSRTMAIQRGPDGRAMKIQ